MGQLYGHTYSLPLEPPSCPSPLSHPSRSSPSPELSSLGCTESSHLLSVLHRRVHIHQRPSPVHPTPSPTPRTCIQMSVPYLCVSAPALHILFSSSFTFTSSCFFFFTVGVGRLNLGPVSWNLLLTWQNPELCSFPSPRVSQRNSVLVACGTPCWVMHLLSAFFSFPASYLHSYWSFFE